MVEITPSLVRFLVKTQFPAWGGLSVSPVDKGGHDNRTFRLGDAMSVRLPSGAPYAVQIEKEYRWLPVLAPRLSLPVPTPLAKGRPCTEYPYPWSVNRWLEGEPAARQIIGDLPRFAEDLAHFLKGLQALGAAGGPVAGRHNFFRGGNLAEYDAEARSAMRTLAPILPIDALERIWELALSCQWTRDGVWVHGDVAPGNLLIRNGTLGAVIDFGLLGVGDPACDYAIAWTFLDRDSRAAFRRALGCDGPTWDRARGWALWKALITYTDPGWADVSPGTVAAILREYPFQ